MKKLFLVFALALFSFTANAQFSGGVNIGLPTGDSSNFSSFSFGVDVNYMLNAGEEFTYGASAGYLNYSGKSGFSSSSFIPLAAAGRYVLSDQFGFGADIGYAINTTSGGTSGFYYKPMLTYNMSDTMNLNAFYSGISINGATLSNVGIGIMFGF